MEENNYDDVQQQEEDVSNYDSIIAAQKMTVDDLKEHMTGPVIAILLHAIILPFVVNMVISEPAPEAPAVEMKPVEKEMEVPPEPPKPPEPPSEYESTTPSENPDQRPEVEVEPIDDVIVENPSLIDDQTMVEVPTAIAMKPNNSAFKLTGLYARRGNKGGAVKGGGGSAEMQKSVSRGLSWLAKVQKADGSWGDGGNSAGITGLATLAFLAYGEMPSTPRYGKTVKKALDRLLEYSHNVDGKGAIKCDGHQYGHAIVTYAISEAAEMTKIPEVIDAMNRLVEPMVKYQSKRGTYDYNYNDKGDDDLSYGGWNYQALKAAFAAGCTVPGLSDAVQNAIPGVKQTYNAKKGSFTYRKKENSPSDATMTPVGVLCLHLLGDASSKEATDGLKYITSKPNLMSMTWKKKDSRTDKEYGWCIYAWYYQTQVIFQAAGGKKDEVNWKQWRGSFEDALVIEQDKEGFWESPASKYEKVTAWREQKGGPELGSEMNLRCYSTALCCLMGEVYYRFLPSFKLVVHQQDKAEGGAAGGESEELIQL